MKLRNQKISINIRTTCYTDYEICDREIKMQGTRKNS